MAALYQILQIRPKSLVIYDYFERAYSAQHYREKRERLAIFSAAKPTHDITQEDNKAKGKLSDGSIRKLRYAVQLLNECSPWVFVLNKVIPEGYYFKLGFLTLTLPAKQGGHSDEFIKRMALMPFITALQKRFGNFSYIWKAEAQTNGNIHFHVTLNAWIEHSTLRHLWNRRMSTLGYIDEYRREQEAWHAKGFKPRPHLYKTWDKKQQGKAYDFGMITNWSSPNTIDIHSVEKIDDLAAYLIKYMSKKEEGKRPLKGKIWGCSRNLAYTNKFETILDGMELNTTLPLSEVFKKVDIGTDRVTVLIRDKEAFEEIFPSPLKSKYTDWLAETYGNKPPG